MLVPKSIAAIFTTQTNRPRLESGFPESTAGWASKGIGSKVFFSHTWLYHALHQTFLCHSPISFPAHSPIISAFLKTFQFSSSASYCT